MKFHPLCQPAVSPEKRIAAERERNRRFWAGTAYTPQSMRVANTTTDPDEAWVLFTPPAREDGEHHRLHPRKIGDRSVYLHEWGAGSA